MRTGARDATVGACLAAAVLAAAASLVPVVSGPGWVVELTATLVVLTVVGVVAGRLGAPAWAVAAVQAVVLVEVLTVVHAPAQAVAGLLPGPAAVAHASTLLDQATAVVQGQSAPIDAVAGVRLVVSAAGGALLVLARLVAVAWGRPALVGLPLVAVHGTGAVFAPGGLGVGAFLLAAAGWLLVVLVARPPAPRWGPVVAPAAVTGARPGLAPLLVGGALALALVVPAAVALPSAAPVFAGGGGGVTSVNPLLDLRQDLTDRSDTVVLSYTTDQEEPQPLRVVTVDSFDGGVWTPDEDEPARPLPEGGELEAPPGLATGTPTVEHGLDVEIRTLRQRYLPLPYPVDRVSVDGAWQVGVATDTVTGAGRTRTSPGMGYQVRYQQVDPDPAVLAAAPPAPQEVLEAYAVAPTDLPPAIADTARRVTEQASATTAYDRAVVLQDWLRSDGGFSYSTSLQPPTSGSALADFLTEKQGYCVHFASAMAVMARTLGIPARVAVGFLPGLETSDGWQVRGSDAHAWPELYFEGAGWTRFEPTPTRGTAPAWTVPATDGEGQVPAPTEQPTTAPQPSQPAQAPAEQQDDPATGDDASAAAGAVAVAGRVLAVVGVAALVLLVLALPALARRSRSARRWRRASRDGTGAAAAEAAWADLVERLGDLGVGPPPSATPRQVRAGVVEHLDGPAPDDVDASLGGLVRAVESSRYGTPAGREDPPALRRAALGVERAVRATLGRRRGLLASWWPASGRRALVGGPARVLGGRAGRAGVGRTAEAGGTSSPAARERASR